MINTAFLRVFTLAMVGFASVVTAQGNRPGSPGTGSPETKVPKLWLVPTGDTVLVYLLDPPAIYRGFTVTRRSANGESVVLTPTPVRPIRDPFYASAMLSDDKERVSLALRATDDAEIVRRLHADPFTGTVLSLVYRRVAQVLGVIYVDTGVKAGNTYTYDVQLVGPGGRPGTVELSGSVQVAEPVLATPSALQAKAGSEDVTLRWTYPQYREEASDYVIGFHVYRAQGSTQEYQRITATPVLRGSPNTMRYTDSDLTQAEQYSYLLRPVDIAGRVGPATAPATVTITRTTTPAPIDDVVATPGNNRVELTWPMAPELDVAGYVVERSTGVDQPFTRLTKVPLPHRQPVFVDSVVQGGIQYFYRVAVVATHGTESAPGNAVAVVPEDNTPPLAPTNPVAEIHRRQVTIRWNASTSPDVRGYYVYRGDHGATVPVRLTSSPVSATTFVDSGFMDRKGLMPGGRYTVRVSAIDLSYNESESVTIDVVIPDDEAPPAPRALALRNVDGRYVLVNWNASEALDIREYVLTRKESTAADQDARTIGRFRTTEPVSDTSAVRGKQYVYRLVAIDTAGNESPAILDSIRFRDVVPPPPTRHVEARMLDTGGIEVRWDRVVSDALVGYHVYRASSPTAVGERVTGVPVTATVWVDGSGTRAAYYIIRVVDRSGNESKPGPAARVGN